MGIRRTVFSQKYLHLFSKIQDLRVGELFGKAAELKFTAPESLHKIDHYNVYIDDNLFQEISSTDCVINLLENSTYLIFITAVDVKGNESLSSNTIEVTTINWHPFLMDNFTGFDGVYSLIRRTANADKCLRIRRLNDNEETDVYLPNSGFVNLDCLVSNGDTLRRWIGTGNNANAIRFYNQISGGIDLIADPVDGSLPFIQNSEIITNNGFPCLKNLPSVSNEHDGLQNIFNNNQRLTNASIITYYDVLNRYSTQNHPCGFATSEFLDNNNYTDLRSMWLLSSDNSFRFYGGNIKGVLNFVSEHIRLGFKEGNNWSDYINGQINFEDKFLEDSQDILDTFGIGQINSTSGFAADEWTLTEVFVSMQSKRSIWRLISQQMNLTYNTY